MEREQSRANGLYAESGITILLTGYARAGKDTVADYLVEKYGFRKMKFAAPLYRMLAAMYGGNITPEYIEENKNNVAFLCNETGGTWRYLLQTLGTEWGRHLVAEDIWVALMHRHINADRECWAEQSRIVVSDCRFLNEADLCHAIPNCFLWSVSRPEKEEKQTHHESEQTVQKLITESTIKLLNNGTIEDLYRNVSLCLRNGF